MLSKMSTRPLGRVTAGAAPFALASAAALSLLQQVPAYVQVAYRAGVNIVILQHCMALWLIALLFAMLGRWGVARWLVLAATAVDIAALVLFHAEIGNSIYTDYLWCATALGVIAFTAPTDLVDLSTFGRAEAAAIGAVLVLGISGFRDMAGPLHVLWLPWPVIVLATAFAIHLAQPGSDTVRASGIALAALPWAPISDPWPWHVQTTVLLDGAAVLVVLFTASALIAGLVRGLREARTPSGSAPSP
ncbi:hypothetical protein [Streptacidiphilus sp. EB129]|uniref:hypothetical protein n=1 Tax=Streptacidiphilus sp. EB129 TaxID=3156262 RepID=UPI003514B2F8